VVFVLTSSAFISWTLLYRLDYVQGQEVVLVWTYNIAHRPICLCHAI